jgi:hypothetical protein
MLAGSCSRRRPANHATVTVTRVRAQAAANTGRGSPPRNTRDRSTTKHCGRAPAAVKPAPAPGWCGAGP